MAHELGAARFVHRLVCRHQRLTHRLQPADSSIDLGLGPALGQTFRQVFNVLLAAVDQTEDDRAKAQLRLWLVAGVPKVTVQDVGGGGCSEDGGEGG